MNLVVIKYNAGNTQSVIYALERLGINPLVTDDFEQIQAADKIIFPGQGEASTTMNYLRKVGLDSLIPKLKQPFLGICIGMQLMCSHSEENDTPCLGIFSEKVRLFPRNQGFKIPHMGWNTVSDLKSPLWANIPENSYMYFVHSYYVEASEHSVANCDYILPFTASMQRDNFYAAQFHPEKSEKMGAKLLENFLKL